MKKRMFVSVLLFALCLSMQARAELKIDAVFSENGENRVVSMIMANPAQGEEALPEEAAERQMQVLAEANLLIQSRFPLAQHLIAMNRAQNNAGGQGIHQTLRLYQDGKTASIAVLWQGEQADGTRGSTAASLALDLETGSEITFDVIFSDPDAAAAAMEAIIEKNIADGLSDYMEYADLLPMPREHFSYDEYGFTVYYPQERYLYFSGRSGAVHFAWHEIDELIAEGSPVYDISRDQPGSGLSIQEQMATGRLPGALAFGVGDRLGDALAALTLLSEPDYTTESLVYQFEEEALRGFALEIPKYVETEEADTQISAVRSSRVQFFGLTTGETTREQAQALLGEPEQSRSYDRDDAADMMLEPGESLLYGLGGNVLQLHFDEDGTLCMVILRASMPDELL